jgi:hypothetical protein
MMRIHPNDREYLLDEVLIAFPIDNYKNGIYTEILGYVTSDYSMV